MLEPGCGTAVQLPGRTRTPRSATSRGRSSAGSATPQRTTSARCCHAWPCTTRTSRPPGKCRRHVGTTRSQLASELQHPRSQDRPAPYADHVNRRTWVVGGVAGRRRPRRGRGRRGAAAACRTAARRSPRSPRHAPPRRSSTPSSGPSSPTTTGTRWSTTLDGGPAPFGKVLGAVGYHYEQWAQVSAYAQGIGVRTRDNPDFTMLDDRTLEPRWSVRSTPSGRRTTPATALPGRHACRPTRRPTWSRSTPTTGTRVWCATLARPRVGTDDPFATQILDDEDVAVLRPGSGREERVVRLDGARRRAVWERKLDADEGDFLGRPGRRAAAGRGRAQ